MEVIFHKTQMVSDDMYVDLLQVNQQLYTMCMEKISQPNVFGVKEQATGDLFYNFMKKYKSE